MNEMANGSYLRASRGIIQLHADAQEYASQVNCSIAEANGGISRHPLSGGALFALTADLFGMHRAVLSLCQDGWAFTTVALLRSIIDLAISAAVITERESDAEFRGFKYTHFFMKSHLNDAAFPVEARAEFRTQIEEGIARLHADQRQRASDFIFREPLRGYWFCPEYRRPTDVLDRLFKPDIRDLYNTFSGGSHGGFIGLRVLKDRPEDIHPNPRPDSRSQDIALAASTRMLLEVIHLRDHFDIGGRHERQYETLLQRLESLRPA